MQFTSVVLALATLSFIAASPALRARDCDKETVSTAYIGPDHNVLVEHHGCDDVVAQVASEASRKLVSRQTTNSSIPNVCGNPCTTYCNTTPNNPLPVVDDCKVISDALLYEAQNGVDAFNINTTTATTTNYVVVKYSNCSSTFVNQANTTISYCDSQWAGVINYVAPHCTPAQNAAGGICLAADNRWFIDVKRS